MPTAPSLRRRLLSAVLLTSLHLPLSAHGTDPPPPDAATRSAVIDRVAALLRDHYVFPEVAEACADDLRRRAAEGAFDDSDGAAAYAEALTTALRAMSHDEHLLVRPRPEPEPMVTTEPPLHPILQRAAREDRDRANHYGIARIEHFESNVGYLDLRFFYGSPAARDVLAGAMTVLAPCDALIIDLRRNQGGYPHQVQFLCSYFFDEPTHLNSLYWRDGDRTDEFWTIPVPGQVRPDVPLYVLTSADTFSGAEEFSYNLQSRQRATIIGARSRGGAHPSARMPIDETFEVIVPTGRAINPVTGTNWEGTGVIPDIAVAADDALTIALEHAAPAAETYRTARIAARAWFDPAHADARQLAADGATAQAVSRVTEDLRRAHGMRLVHDGDLAHSGFDLIRAGHPALGLAVHVLNIELHPESPFAHEALGDAYGETGRIDDACAAYERALDLTTDPHLHQRVRARLDEIGAPPPNGAP